MDIIHGLGAGRFVRAQPCKPLDKLSPQLAAQLGSVLVGFLHREGARARRPQAPFRADGARLGLAWHFVAASLHKILNDAQCAVLRARCHYGRLRISSSYLRDACDEGRPLKVSFAALRATGLLDAPAEERFDRLTRLARRLLNTPVALVSLLDADRQFFLSAQGLPEPWASLRETPLSYSFCRLVVETELSLAVKDARRDPRVHGNSAIEDLGVVSYLGVPLALPGGRVVGALCVIDQVPRGWAMEDEEALADLGGAVMAEFASGLQLAELNATSAALHASEARLRETQANLLHVSRLSAAGGMASALAHELNQPLTAVASAVRAAQRMLTSSSGGGAVPAEIGEAMDLAVEQALRAGQIVRRLRDFVTRGGEADKRLEDLATLAEEAGALALVGARERGVHVRFRFDPQLPRVLVDRIQIQQVLLNLMRNALEAMAQGSDKASPRRELTVTAAASGPEMVEVAVADTGPGLAPEIAGRLFTAFVSTKPGGMGMGLSICRSIVEAHGGRLWAEPNGGGAVFRFTLPTAPQGAAPD